MDKTDKGARFSNMIIQKLEKRDAVSQLDIWKKVSQSKTKEKKKGSKKTGEAKAE